MPAATWKGAEISKEKFGAHRWGAQRYPEPLGLISFREHEVTSRSRMRSIKYLELQAANKFIF